MISIVSSYFYIVGILKEGVFDIVWRYYTKTDCSNLPIAKFESEASSTTAGKNQNV
jgi:hypothetical protein